MGACIRCAQFEIEYDRALRTIASLTAERDALQVRIKQLEKGYDTLRHALTVREQRLATLTAERDALAAAMPSEGSDAALAYAAMKAERDALNVKVAELETTLSTVWEAITAFGSKR